jgi:5-formyltetrahydrofolate cyclo-ligase
MEKRDMRRTLLAQRAALTAAERQRLGALAQAALISSDAFRRAGLILIYAAFRGEVETDQIAQAAVAAGKRLALPRVIKEPRGLVLHQYSGDPSTLATGAYSIREPRPEWPVVAPAQVDLVVTPGVGFDLRGHRLGYGGGYYDRLLPMVAAANPTAVLVGLAYSLQVVATLPSAPHDIPMDALATEQGFVWRRGDA